MNIGSIVVVTAGRRKQMTNVSTRIYLSVDHFSLLYTSILGIQCLQVMKCMNDKVQ